jgi:hypothetical protein
MRVVMNLTALSAVAARMPLLDSSTSRLIRLQLVYESLSAVVTAEIERFSITLG